jgi:maleamate amidohydrolase
MARPWEGVISKREQEIYAAAGYGKTRAPLSTARPALVIIDVTINFVGDRPEPILESIRRGYPNSCGESGWKAVHKIADLLKVARSIRAPVFYSMADPSLGRKIDSSWEMKKTRNSGLEGNRIPDEVKPAPADAIIMKRKPSAFFGTPLISVLNSLHVDTLLVTGCTTSGCVRATVLDSFSYSFKTLVVEECVFDRAEIPHKVNLFDMNQKYADVITLKEAIEFLDSVGRASRKAAL